jgi:hypothetical protein
MELIHRAIIISPGVLGCCGFGNGTPHARTAAVVRAPRVPATHLSNLNPSYKIVSFPSTADRDRHHNSNVHVINSAKINSGEKSIATLSSYELLSCNDNQYIRKRTCTKRWALQKKIQENSKRKNSEK